MSTRSFVPSLPFAAALSITFLASACDGTGNESASDDLPATEASLTNAQDSLQATHEAAQVCFETYESCRGSAAFDAEGAACREDLKTCLPTDAPRPPRCAPPPDADGGLLPPHPRGPRPSNGSQDSSALADGPRPGRDCDGGVDEANEGKERGHGPHSRHACGRPPISGKHLGECRDAAEAALAAGADAKAAHDQCVKDAFAEHVAELCARATELCDQPGAPDDACDRMTRACAEQARADLPI